MSTPTKPTEGELAILRILWKKGRATVREVHDVLSQQKEIGYTTTLKLMQIMHEKKGLLDRTRSGKTHIYRPLVSEEVTRGQLLDRLVDTAFSGSATQLIMQALGTHQPSTEELDEIRRFLDQIDPTQTAE